MFVVSSWLMRQAIDRMCIISIYSEVVGIYKKILYSWLFVFSRKYNFKQTKKKNRFFMISNHTFSFWTNGTDSKWV